MPELNGPFDGVPQPGVCVFVAGTGTDVGKTFLSCALLRMWRRNGLVPAAIKPVLSGFDPDDPSGSDAGRLMADAGMPLTPSSLEQTSPWRFRAALSPDMAAARERRPLSLDEVTEFSRHSIAAARGPLLIESAGGVMSPLTETATMLDWADALGIPVVLVAGAYLGTISHTLTAIQALNSREVPILGVAVNGGMDTGIPLGETLASLRTHDPQTRFEAFTDAPSAERCAADLLGAARAFNP